MDSVGKRFLEGDCLEKDLVKAKNLLSRAATLGLGVFTADILTVNQVEVLSFHQRLKIIIPKNRKPARRFRQAGIRTKPDY